MTVLKKTAGIMAAIGLTVASAFAGFMPASALFASAEGVEETVNAFDTTAVEEDLKGVDLSAYGYDPSAVPQLINFSEYCFAKDILDCGNFGIYIYVYNPTGEKVSEREGANVLNMATEYASDSGNPSRYDNMPLVYCGATDSGLILKFRVFDDSGKILGNARKRHAKDGERRYDVAGLQIWRQGAAEPIKDYTVGYTFYFSGYSKGYGGDDEESTLECLCESTLTLSNIEVHSTTYRPEGTNGTKETQDLLTSVYFSLPNYVEYRGERIDIREKFGKLYGVHAQWIEAVTKPILVTGTREVYKGLSPYIGTQIDVFNAEIPYGFCTDMELHNYGQGAYEYVAENIYNVNYFKDGYLETGEALVGDRLETLYWIFPADFSANSADTHTVLSEEIENYAKRYSKDHTDYIAGTTYSKDLFDSWGELKDETLYAYQTKDLTSVTSNENWLLDYFGFKNKTDFSVPVIQEIINCESAEQVSEEYFVDEKSFETIKKEFEREDRTLYVFHFAVDDYTAKEATQFYVEQGMFGDYYQRKLDTNAYLAQATTYLNFDVIDVTLMDENGKESVLGVISDPIDIFPPLTPPLDVTKDEMPQWWQVALAIAGVCIAILIVTSLIEEKTGGNRK